MDLPMDYESKRKEVNARLDNIRRRQKSLALTADPEILSLVHDSEWLVGLVEEFIKNNTPVFDDSMNPLVSFPNTECK